MLYSMTGFGRAEKSTATQRIVIEIKSVNSKSLDLRTRVAPQFQSKDIALRKILGKRLLRGKIDMNILVENTEDTAYQININAFNNYCKTLREVAVNQNIAAGDLMYTITRMPGVVVQNIDEVKPENWAEVLAVVEEAISKIEAYRAEEGAATEKDILENINIIQNLLTEVNPKEQERIDKIKNRLLQSLESLSLNSHVDENRLEQEMIFYLDKFDLNEEKIRLEQHCIYFKEEIAKNTIAKGKKLGFILQEIGREINTLGSKANSAAIQRMVIQMKNHADKIKEQLANII